jgi:hypothetical protein
MLRGQRVSLKRSLTSKGQCQEICFWDRCTQSLGRPAAVIIVSAVITILQLSRMWQRLCRFYCGDNMQQLLPEFLLSNCCSNSPIADSYCCFCCHDWRSFSSCPETVHIISEFGINLVKLTVFAFLLQKLSMESKYRAHLWILPAQASVVWREVRWEDSKRVKWF